MSRTVSRFQLCRSTCDSVLSAACSWTASCLVLVVTLFSVVLRDDTCCAAPLAVEDVKTVFVARQPVVLILIGAIAYEDGQVMKAEASKPQA